MERKNRYNPSMLILLSVLPGLGHLLTGKRNKGLHLFLFTSLMISIVIFRFDTFIHAIQSGKPGIVIAPLFILGSILVCITFSVFDIQKGLKKKAKEVSGMSPMQFAFRRFSENKLAVVSAYIILALFCVAILAPLISPYDPILIGNLNEGRYNAPSWYHLFGTDEFGRDLFSRALYGARVSLSIGFLSVIIAVSLGTIYGAIAGYFGGLIDNIMMRIVDVIKAFPILFLLLILVAIFEINIVVMVLIMGLTSWMGTARYIRGEILSIKEREFVESARAIGLPNRLIIVRHLIPNAISPILVSAALMVGGMIGMEAGLSFLGIGIRPPTPTWGNMISTGQDSLFFAWWIAVFPGLLLAITVICFNLLADGLRDAMDPKTLMRKYV